MSSRSAPALSLSDLQLSSFLHSEILKISSLVHTTYIKSLEHTMRSRSHLTVIMGRRRRNSQLLASPTIRNAVVPNPSLSSKSRGSSECGEIDDASESSYESSDARSEMSMSDIKLWK